MSRSIVRERSPVLNAYYLMMVALTSMLVTNALYKGIDDWFRLRELCEAEDVYQLQKLIKSKREWIYRHLLCAVAGVMLVTVIKLTPSLEDYNLLAGLFAVHIIFSLIFALLESLYAQRISSAVNVRIMPSNMACPQDRKSLPPEGENA
jgi:hypothetical protein